jgi:hypothetical protein
VPAPFGKPSPHGGPETAVRAQGYDLCAASLSAGDGAVRRAVVDDQRHHRVAGDCSWHPGEDVGDRRFLVVGGQEEQDGRGDRGEARSGAHEVNPTLVW